MLHFISDLVQKYAYDPWSAAVCLALASCATFINDSLYSFTSDDHVQNLLSIMKGSRNLDDWIHFFELVAA